MERTVMCQCILYVNGYGREFRQIPALPANVFRSSLAQLVGKLKFHPVVVFG